MIYAECEKAENHKPVIECPDRVKAEESFEIKVYVKGHPSRVDRSIRYVDIYISIR